MSILNLIYVTKQRLDRAKKLLTETKLPIIAPAVVNALYHLTGKRYRSLPLVEL